MSLIKKKKASSSILFQLQFQHQRLAAYAQPAQQLLSAVILQLHIWDVPPLFLSSASVPLATWESLAATAVSDTYSLPSKEKYNNNNN